METIIQIIQTISDNRFWLLPIWILGVLSLLAVEIKDIFKNI